MVRIVRVDPAWLDGYPVLDVLYPYAGPCMFCGGPDKRHRLADSITENVRAGDSPELVSRAYDVPLPVVNQLVATWRQ